MVHTCVSLLGVMLFLSVKLTSMVLGERGGGRLASVACSIATRRDRSVE